MKRYFVNGQEISAVKAAKIDERNEALKQSDNIADWAGIKFITVIK